MPRTDARGGGGGGATILSGTLAARPAAGIADRYYWATDIVTMFRDTGVAWEVVGAQWYMRELPCYHGEGIFDDYVNLSLNYVYYAPIQVPRTLTADGIILYHGATINGNLYAALYSRNADFEPLNRLAVSNSVVAGALGTGREHIPFTAQIQLTPEVYFLALEISAAQNYPYVTLWGWLPAAFNGCLTFFRENLGAYLIPPAVATPVYAANADQCVRMALRIASIP